MNVKLLIATLTLLQGCAGMISTSMIQNKDFVNDYVSCPKATNFISKDIGKTYTRSLLAISAPPNHQNEKIIRYKN